MVIDIIKDELVALRDKYGDPRRTKIVDATGEFEVEDLIADEPMVITISHNGYIKRLPVGTYRRQRRGGRGVAGFGGQEEDFVEQIFVASTHSYLLFFSNRGRCYWVKVHELPQAGRTARGKAIVNLLSLSPQERITSTVPVRDFTEEGYLVMATRKGVIKRCDLSDFSNPRRGGIIAIGLHEGDSLVGVALTRGTSEVVLAKRAGKAVRFRETDVRSMGRAAAGVRGAELEDDDDEVVGMVAVSRPDAEILVVTERGFGKRTPIDDYRLTARGTKGVLTLRTTDKNGRIAAIKEVANRRRADDHSRARGVLIRLPVSGSLAARTRHPGRASHPPPKRAMGWLPWRTWRATKNWARASRSKAPDWMPTPGSMPTPIPRSTKTPARTKPENPPKRAIRRPERVHKPRAGNGQESDKRKAAPYLDRASSSTVARLSAYFRVLGEFERENVETISSKRLAERCGITSAQVRKDLSVFGNFGRRGLGYNVQDLRGEIGAILGLGRRWRVALIGAGNLGHALFAYREFQKQGFQIEAIFDVDPAKIGQTWDGVRIAPIAELPQRAANPGIGHRDHRGAGAGRAAGRRSGDSRRHPRPAQLRARQDRHPRGRRGAGRGSFHRDGIAELRAREVRHPATCRC
jgi:hypothetical protein